MSHETRAIERSLLIEQPIEKVWQAITEPSQVNQWFGDVAEYELREGAHGWFGWEAHGRFAMRIERVEPMTAFAWRWMADRDVTFDEAQSTLVEWRLEALSATSTRLWVRESGFKTPESRQENVGGWTEELGHLSAHLLGP